MHNFECSPFDFSLLGGYFSPPTRLLPMAGLQLLLDKLLSLYYLRSLNIIIINLNLIIITGFISTALPRFEPGTSWANSCKAVTTIELTNHWRCDGFVLHQNQNKSLKALIGPRITAIVFQLFNGTPKNKRTNTQLTDTASSNYLTNLA